jgi:hypothetical protein
LKNSIKQQRGKKLQEAKTMKERINNKEERSLPDSNNRRWVEKKQKATHRGNNKRTGRKRYG